MKEALAAGLVLWLRFGFPDVAGSVPRGPGQGRLLPKAAPPGFNSSVS